MSDIDVQVLAIPFSPSGHVEAGPAAELTLKQLEQWLRPDNSVLTASSQWPQMAGRIHCDSISFRTQAQQRNWDRRVREALARVQSAERFPMLLLGNHLGALPVYNWLATRFERSPVTVVSFDAHLDIHAHPLSSGSFLRHVRRSDCMRIVNVGSRELWVPTDDETRYLDDVIGMDRLARYGVGACIDSLCAQLGRQEGVFIDIDMDVLDSFWFRDSPTHEPLGLTPRDLFGALLRLWEHNPVGLSFSEFHVGPTREQPTLALVTQWIIYFAQVVLGARPLPKPPG